MRQVLLSPLQIDCHPRLKKGDRMGLLSLRPAKPAAPAVQSDWARKRTSDAARRDMSDCMAIIFARVAAGLENLTMVMPEPWEVPLPHLTHPVLQDFTLFATREGRQQWHYSSTPQRSLPALRRLYIGGGHYSYERVASLVNASPALTHLFSSGPESAHTVAGSLRELLKTPDPSLNPIQPLHPPRSLQKCIIQPRLPFYRIHSAARLVTLLDQFQAIAADRPEVVLVPSKFWEPDIDGNVEEARGLWLNRISGGLGQWWDESDD
ncbi:hypothetical protein JAAARDRAFT_207561 [Jaapia argillacea MUCL 33604]|uniref:Uncharacterized protein n=1 Tax=Jaapia argillacea MUCL 33604 TaxID=933084 RepID=A0A067Q180_9AGAM|nr:hypothetical protein JAAARDRAFT_207561 [Jaapia argillacea MUCL 33604]